MPNHSWWLRHFTPMGWFICSLIGSTVFFCLLGIGFRRDLHTAQTIEQEIADLLRLMTVSQRQDDVSRQDTLERVIRLQRSMELLATSLHEERVKLSKEQAELSKEIVEALETAVPEARWKLQVRQDVKALRAQVAELSFREARQPP